MTQRFKNPIGVNTYSYLWTTPASQCVMQLAKTGYREFELLLSPPHLPLDELTAADRKRFAAACVREGVTIRSLNVPSLDHNLASSMRRMREYSVQLFIDSIDFAADLDAAYLVIVPGRMSPLFPPTQELREAWMREGLDPLVEYAEKRGVKLVLENVPFASFPDAKTLGAFVRSYASPTLSVCYDAANAHFIGESPADGLRSLGELVSLVHLSDTTQQVWRHDEIGLGDVPFAAVRAALDDIEFKGTCMLEIISSETEAAIVRSHRKIEALGFPSLEEQEQRA
ncbi:sugar phosphate isomerase/epimerase [Caballeronia sp. LP003]|uniref:sugar phosphate isomerase/epimerase family protein n=1 Tax=Caballeronia sp. LP003 TaxID=3038551 RepID=UPI00285C5CCD|nr:sugar phosphate isomerase/epimerase family protein [Caballeronia sp. LP003]MDR5785406.1 sugar phosphate isomerase/epimerase [Caballeronia sp. LP003]